MPATPSSDIEAKVPDLAADTLRNSAARVVPIVLPGFVINTLVPLADVVLLAIVGVFGDAEGRCAPSLSRGATSPETVCFEA